MKLCDGAQSRQWVFTVQLCYALHLFYLHWHSSRELLPDHRHGNVGAGSRLLAPTNHSGVSAGSVKDAALFLIAESLQHDVTVHMNEGE